MQIPANDNRFYKSTGYPKPHDLLLDYAGNSFDDPIVMLSGANLFYEGQQAYA